MKKYTPRRQSSRWLDGDCPAGVLAIYDDPRTTDRYTVIYREALCGDTYADMVLETVVASAYPFHPQGIGQHGEFSAPDCASWRYDNRHRAAKWSSLPPDVQRLVRQDLSQ